MQLNRKDLLTALECIKPALAGKSPIIGLDAAWFLTDHLYAYNGVICVDAPFEIDFDGGVDGDVLTKFVASCPTDQIDLSKNNNSITISSGKAKITLPILSSDRSARDFPQFEVAAAGYSVNDDFANRLRNNLISVSASSALAAYSGVLLIEDTNNTLNMFSTDSKSITWERGQIDLSLEGKKILLPGEFCTQLIRLFDEEENYLLIDEGFAAFETGDRILLISRLLDPDGSPNYLAAIRRHLSEVPQYVPIPDGLKAALERCELVKPERGNDPISLSIREKKLDISIETLLGSASDQLELEVVHPEIKIVIDSSLILRALGRYKEFAVTEGAMILRNDENSYHLISPMSN